MNPQVPADIDLTGFGVVALLLACAGVALWWWRSRGGVTAGDPIRVVSLRSLGGKRMLALIEVDEARFLLGMTDAQISCLGRLPAADVPELRAADGEAA